MDEDLNHVYETLYELDGRLKAIESVIATLVKLASAENQVCDATREADSNALVHPVIPLSQAERERRVRLALNGWNEATIGILGRESEHLRFPHEHE